MRQFRRRVLWGTGVTRSILTPNLLGPAIDLNGAGAGADFAADFTEGDPAVSIVDATATLTDADSDTIASLTVTLTGLVDTGEEVLDADVGATGITKSYVAPTLTLTGPASVADFQTVMRTVTYENTAVPVTAGARTATFLASDGINTSNAPETTITISESEAEEIVVNAVNFDGTNDYLSRGAGLTDAADNKTGIYSFWIKFANDDAGPTILDQDDTGAASTFQRIGSDEVQGNFASAASSPVFLGRSTTKVTVSSGWTHVLMSVNSATGDRGMWINDVLETLLVDTFAEDGVIDWTRGDWFVGATSAAGSKLNGDLAEVYMTNEFLDFSVEANRRKFISAGGKPVDLGLDGSAPTGTAPLVYLSGATVDWHTNKGSGGGFTENGALTDASSSPSDLQWAQIGNGLVISGIVPSTSLAALGSARIALASDAKLRTYDFDGTDWAQTGNTLTITGLGESAIAALSSMRVIVANRAAETLTTYDWDGADWSQTGNALTITGMSTPALAALSSARVAYYDIALDELRTYDFDGTDWAQVGNGLSFTVTTFKAALAGLSSSRIALVDGANDALRTFDWDGTDWAQVGNALSIIPAFSTPALASLNLTRVAFIDSGVDQLKAYDFDGANWTRTAFTQLSGIGSDAGLATLTNNRVALIDAGADKLIMYELQET